MRREIYLAVSAGALSLIATTNAFIPVQVVRCHSNNNNIRQRSSSSLVARFMSATVNKTNEPAAVIDITPVAYGTTPDSLPLTPTTTSGSTTSVSAAEAVVGDSFDSTLPLPLIQLALAGSITTLVSDIATHPVDCIKTLQQSDAGISLTFMSAAGQLWADYGIAGFYFGFLTYALSDAIGGALKFSVWEGWKQQSHGFPLADSTVGGWVYVWMGAALAFVASSVLIVPGELLKQQLQMSHYDDLISAVHGIYAGSGLLGFFQGYEGVLYRDIPYTILELGLYDLFKSMIIYQKSTDESPSVLQEILAGAVTGGITAVLTTPIDVVKTKMMVDAEYSGYSFFQCFLASVDHHGWTSVFSGVEARVAWILPFVAIYLPTYDFLKRQLYRRQQKAGNNASR